jgi:hypothetical protein
MDVARLRLQVWHIFHALWAKPTTMQELINSLQKTGLTREQAQSAVTHVLDYLKQRLPESVHPYVDQAATGKSSRDMFSGLANTVGGYIRKQPI